MQRAHHIVEVVGEQDNVDGRVRWGAGVAEVAEVSDKGATSAAIWWRHYARDPGIMEEEHCPDGGGALLSRTRCSRRCSSASHVTGGWTPSCSPHCPRAIFSYQIKSILIREVGPHGHVVV